ncbi:MAG: hypothetical protein ACLQU5_18545 [Isosphaeraceae bacterium]
MPILRSLPVRNFGSTRVPRRFHSSAGMLPDNVMVVVVGPVGGTTTGGSTTVGSGSPGGLGSPGVGAGFFFSSSALAFLSKTTPDSKAISSEDTGSEYQSRS